MNEAPRSMERAATAAAQSVPLAGVALLVGITFVWGASFPSMKVVLEEVPVLTFRAICLIFAGVGIAMIALAGGRSLAVPRRLWPALALCSLFNVIGWHLLTGYSLSAMNAGPGIIVAYTMPLWTVLLAAIFLGERITPAKVAGTILGLAGLGALVLPDIHAIATQPGAVGLMFLAAVSWAIGTVILKAADWTIPTTVLTAWQLSLGGIPVAVAALMQDTHDWTLSDFGALNFAFVLLGPMLFCQWAWFTVVRIMPSSIAALGTLLIPVVGVLVAGVMLGERVGWPELSALVLVCGGLGAVLLPPALARLR